MPSLALSVVRRRTLAMCVLSGALAIGVSACGSSSSSTTSVASAGAGAGGATSSAAYTARLNYAKCMRAHGVNVPDPSANGGPAGGAGGAGAGAGGFRQLRSSPNFQAASTACAKYRSKAFGGGNFSPAQRAAAQQALVKFAECMRSNSIDIPDPSTSAGGGFGIFRSIPSTQRNSPQFKKALQACSSTLPRFGRGGAGGGPPGGGSSA
jgi:hypothetical protein